MSAIDYGKYLIRKPLYEEGIGIKNLQSPAMTYVSNTIIPGVNYHLTMGWVYGIPDPNSYIHEHAHDFDEIMLYWGCDYKTPQDLGAEIEYYIGGQSVTFNTTTGIFIPKGVPHGPITWEKFKKPHIHMSIMLGTGSSGKDWDKNGTGLHKEGLPQKRDDFDYEQYVVRSPVRDIGPLNQTGRQNPSMTYMSSAQINNARTFIEFGWIWDEIEIKVDKMVHHASNEIVLHIGSDPEHPEDLGTDLEFTIGDQPIRTSSSCAAYIPKDLYHGPVIWRKVRKPFIEMAILLDVGAMREAWQNPDKPGAET